MQPEANAGRPRRYGYARTLEVPFAAALERARAALQAEGFGVLAEIDLQAKLREKLGVERGRYVILGACNPPLAHQALAADADIGLLLPCNVVVYEADRGVVVAAIDAERMMSLVGDPGIEPVARQVDAKLRRAIDSL